MDRLTNPTRRYDWGSPTAIPALLGIPADGTPQAELWLGAHPGDPSALADGRRLDAVIAGDPDGILGPRVHAEFGARLPYLAKVLAAARPLSLQAHPDAARARAGYAAEEAAGVPVDAPHRRYRDPHHKPEMVIAVEPFDALCGWRDLQATRVLLAGLGVDHAAWPALQRLLAADRPPETVLRWAVTWLLTGDAQLPSDQAVPADRQPPQPGPPHPLPSLPPEDRAALVGAVAAADPLTAGELAAHHPGDPGVVVGLLLNRVRLAPGEALHLGAGNVHAYLRGTAVEVMAASDNVLRAGLTTKHVDVPELLAAVDWHPSAPPRVQPVRDGVWRRYRPPVAEFEVAMADLGADLDADLDLASDPDPDRPPPADPAGAWHDVPIPGGPRIALVLRGEVAVRTAAGTLELGAGQSALVPDRDGTAAVRGRGTVVVAAVPGSSQAQPASPEGRP